MSESACVCGARRLGIADGVAVFACGSTYQWTGDAWVLEQSEACRKDDEQMLVSFVITLLDADAVMHQLLHSVKKSPLNIEITPPSKTEAKEAKNK